MNALMKSVYVIAAGGLVLSLAETLLPESGIKRTARIAIGFLFLELFTTQILGIIP